MKTTPCAASLRNSAVVPVAKASGGAFTQTTDAVAIEEPVEIRLQWQAEFGCAEQSVAITMRTPGADLELACGFLFSEGILEDRGQVESHDAIGCNAIRIRLCAGVQPQLASLERHSFISSSCGVCGKKSIDDVRRHCRFPLSPGPLVESRTIHGLPDKLRSAQRTFERTGGLHAAGLFTAEGELLGLFEDVGRHNALDKLIGRSFLSGELPAHDRIVLVSGRTSFELVQKAAMAGIAILAGVGAPSSLAVSLAAECGMTLLGFVRDERFNIYAGPQRLQR